MKSGRHFKVILEWDTEESEPLGPSLGHLSTYGKTKDEALEMTREAIVGYFEAAAKEGFAEPSMPEPEILDLEVAV